MFTVGNVELDVGLKDGMRIIQAFEHATKTLDLKQTLEDFKEILAPAVRAAADAIANDNQILPAILGVLEPAKRKLFEFTCKAIVDKHGQEYLDDLLRRFGQSTVT